MNENNNEQLTVYIYNVRFGEAILVEVPDGDKRRFILVDAGNWQSGQAGLNQPLLDALKDINRRTQGKIDLYVMTHEHMDHVEGLRSAARKGCNFDIDTVWMTASSEPGYYDRFTDAREKKKRLDDAAAAFMALSVMPAQATDIKAMYELNAARTVDCVDFIRNAGGNVFYVYRDCDLRNKHPFTGLGLRILAPEQDTAVYYKSLYESLPRFNLVTAETPSDSSKSLPMPLPGVDGGAFYNLIEHMDGAFSESVYAIDAAGNDTSVVFELTWRGRRLLFTGDAEQESWEQMYENTSLEPLDFFKIGHHGSITARPPLAALDKILPQIRRDHALAALSTYPGVPFKSIPDTETLNSIKARTKKVYSSTGADDGKPVRVTFTPLMG
jgi:beta-lactamase superfamily II metal-dependent hydrolase